MPVVLTAMRRGLLNNYDRRLKRSVEMARSIWKSRNSITVAILWENELVENAKTDNVTAKKKKEHATRTQK